MDLLVGDEEGELLVFLDLSLNFESQVFNGLLKFVDDHLFLADKIQFDHASDHEFYVFFILFSHCEILNFKGLFKIVEADQRIRINLGTVQGILSLRIDNQLMILLLKNKAYRFVRLLAFHLNLGMNYYQSLYWLTTDFNTDSN